MIVPKPISEEWLVSDESDGRGRGLFIVDNSDADRKVRRYVSEWCDIPRERFRTTTLGQYVWAGAR